jgi:hypothetical protein
MTKLCAPLTNPWGSPKETQAFQFFLERVAPWLDGHQPFEGQTLWAGAVPRTAASLPGLRHLICAIALIEMPIHDATPSALSVHSNSILRYYTLGLRELRRPDLTGPESALGPVLAWLIELHNVNHTRAQMHIRGARALHARALRHDPDVESDDFVHDRRLEDMLAYMSMWHCLRARLTPNAYTVIPAATTTQIVNGVSSKPGEAQAPTPSPVVDQGLLAALTALNTQITSIHSSQVRTAFTHYFSHTHSSTMTSAELSDARTFVLSWERTIYQNKYLTRQATVIFNALHLLCGLAVILLPVPFESAELVCSNIQAEALSQILRRCEWMIGLKFAKSKVGVECGNETDQEELERTVGLVLRVTRWLAPLEESRRQAGRLLLKIGVDFDSRKDQKRCQA